MREEARKRFPPGPYCGRAAVLTTKQSKERAVAREFRAALGLVVTVPEEIDTDLLGTFTGEVERVGTRREVAIGKARLGMRASGLPLGLASERSFGPHPLMPFLIASDHEILAFVDDDLGITVVEGLLTEETNFGHCPARTLNDLAAFMKQAQFPSHALIVRPNDGLKPGFMFKGIADAETLEAQCRGLGGRHGPRGNRYARPRQSDAAKGASARGLPARSSPCHTMSLVPSAKLGPDRSREGSAVRGLRHRDGISET